jgi:chitinase
MRFISVMGALLGVGFYGFGCGSASGRPSGADAAADAAMDSPRVVHGDALAPDAGKPADAGKHEDAGSHPKKDAGPPSAAWVMGYFANWDDAANGGFYAVSAIDWDVVTHVAAAFYVPDGSGGWAPGYFDSKLAAPLIAAAHAHGRKAIASIGGSGSGPVFESSMQSAHQDTFLASLQALLTEGYDGLDIDWEGGNLSLTEDQALETTLVGSLRTKNPSAILTFTAGYVNENSPGDFSFYGTISAQLDRINLMTYGMSGPWPGWESWHSAPLHWNKNSSTPTGIDASVSHYLKAGVPAAKLGVGAGFFGECYTAPVTAPVQALGGSTISASDGTMSYRNIMASYYSSASYNYDGMADVPYLTLDGKNAQKCTYVSYEDEKSIAAKAAWVKAQGLGGMIIWTLSEGFIQSGGSTVPEQNPLVEAMKGVF